MNNSNPLDSGLTKSPDAPSLNFSVSPVDFELIHRIVQRFGEAMRTRPVPIPFDSFQLVMDLCANQNNRPLNLLQFLMCDYSDFVHELALIHLHVDRGTGKIDQQWRLMFEVKNVD